MSAHFKTCAKLATLEANPPPYHLSEFWSSHRRSLHLTTTSFVLRNDEFCTLHTNFDVSCHFHICFFFSLVQGNVMPLHHQNDMIVEGGNGRSMTQNNYILGFEITNNQTICNTKTYVLIRMQLYMLEL